VSEEHERRRRSFDEVAERYADARPGYPPEVYDEIGLRVAPPARVLEIGPGPGVATVALAERGYAVLAVELGPQLADVARRRLAAFPGARVVTADFHAFDPEPGTFDLVLSASAFHWIVREVGYRKAWNALRDGGWLALMWNASVRGRGRAARFWDASDGLYARHAPSLARPPEARVRSRARGELDRRREIRSSGLFSPVFRRSWRWQRTFDAPAYLALLDTYSDHRVLEPRQRRALYHALTGLIGGEFGGSVVREYLTILYLARRLPAASRA
jgi:SAM-dependent methyltransferase